MPSYEVRDIIEAQLFGGEIEAIASLDPGGAFRRPRPFAENVLPRQFSFWARGMAPYASPEGDAFPWHLLRTRNAAVAGRDGVVLFEKGWVDRIHLQFVDFGRPSGQLRRSGERIEADAPSRRIEGPCLMGFNAGYANYAHWTLDGLPLLHLLSTHPALSDCPILLPETPAGHFSQQALERLGVEPRRVVRIGDEVVQVDELVLASYFSFDRTPPSVAGGARRLKAAVLGDPPPEEPARRRLFVSRADTAHRVLLNEAAVIEALQPYGFEVIVPGRLRLEDQIRTFDSAELVVGPHGAAMANAVYCRPGAALIEVFSEYSLNAIFWNVAAMAGLDYGYVVGSAFDQDVALTLEAGSWSGPYVVDPALVAAAVEKALRVAPPLLRSTVAGDTSVMTAKQTLLGQLWRGTDPFETFPPRLYATDLQGWNSDHPYLTQVIDALLPRLVVEVGVWKGCSVITMAERMKAVGCDGVVLAVDTWLGSWDHWLVEDYFDDMGFRDGYPTLFWRFMSNVVHKHVQDHIVPLPLDSLNAFEVLSRKGLSADVVHIDAGHDYLAVKKDLEVWWSLIRPGGVLIADDYFDDENKAWPEVKQAVDDFVTALGLDFRHERGKGWIIKP